MALLLLCATTLVTQAADVTLAWDANPEPDVAGYKIYFGSPAGSFDQVVDAGNTTTTTIPNVTAGATYSFYATCYNTSGLESEPSNIVQYTIPLVEDPTSNTPVALNQVTTVMAGAETRIFLQGSDPNGDPMTFNLNSFPQFGQITSYAVNSDNMATITYIAPASFTGQDSFTFDVNDGYETSLAATVSINVIAGNPPPGGTPVTEIEDAAASITGTMTAATDANASNGSFLTTTEPENGTATFMFRVEEEADFVVWCRVKTPSAASDSFYVSLNDDPYTLDIFDASQEIFSNEWKWTPLSGRGGIDAPYSLPPYAIPQRIFHLMPGIHTLTFTGREAGTSLDTIIVTSDLAYSPATLPVDESFAITQTYSVVDGYLQLTWTSTPGEQYRVLYKDDLNSTTWQETSEVITATGEETSTIVGGSLSKQQFYRIEAIR